MSIIVDLGKNKENLTAIISRYTDELDKAEAELRIEGKTLERANYEQPSHQFFYDERKAELYILMKYLEREVERVKGELWVRYTEKHSESLNTKDKEQYINKDKKYLDELELYLHVQELYEKYKALVDAFTTRGYALRNITNLRVASLENVVI